MKTTAFITLLWTTAAVAQSQVEFPKNSSIPEDVQERVEALVTFGCSNTTKVTVTEETIFVDDTKTYYDLSIAGAAIGSIAIEETRMNTSVTGWNLSQSICAPYTVVCGDDWFNFYLELNTPTSKTKIGFGGDSQPTPEADAEVSYFLRNKAEREIHVNYGNKLIVIDPDGQYGWTASTDNGSTYSCSYR